jgi:glucose-1-phosphate cytidylyltransferase
MSDVTVDLRANAIEVHEKYAEPWRITLVNTGEATMTGGRLKRVAPYLAGEEAFCFTYGDGVGDVDIGALVEFHRTHGKLATVTAVQPPGRFGVLEMAGNAVTGFREKPQGDGNWINGGFFVLSPEVIAHIDDDATIWEREPMERLAADGQLQAWFHEGFWQPMDTLRDKIHLEELWASGKAPWHLWA